MLDYFHALLVAIGHSRRQTPLEGSREEGKLSDLTKKLGLTPIEYLYVKIDIISSIRTAQEYEVDEDFVMLEDLELW